MFAYPVITDIRLKFSNADNAYNIIGSSIDFGSQ